MKVWILLRLETTRECYEVVKVCLTEPIAQRWLAIESDADIERDPEYDIQEYEVEGEFNELR